MAELLGSFIWSEEIEEEYHELFVDIDIKFDLFPLTDIYRLVVYNAYNLHKWFPNLTYDIRRSAHDNVHIRVIDMDGPFSYVEMLTVRALLHDDLARLGIDLRRMAYYGHTEVNRIFAAKAPGGRVGEWEPWDVKEIYNSIDWNKEVKIRHE